MMTLSHHVHVYLVVTNLLDVLFWNSKFVFNNPHEILQKNLELECSKET